jgi:hypothetical protein
MEVQITIEMEKVMSEVNKHFALIGKRLKDKNGDTMFAKATLSSEEKGIMKQYINAAAETFVAELAPQVTYYKNGDAMVIKFENSRWADGEDGITVPFEGNFMGYVIAYVSNAVLGMTEVELAQKYAADMANHIAAAIKLIYYKTPPASSNKSLADMTGEIIID